MTAGGEQQGWELGNEKTWSQQDSHPLKQSLNRGKTFDVSILGVKLLEEVEY